MTTEPETDHRFDLYTIRNCFGAEACREIIDEMLRSAVSPAVVYGQGESGAVDERVRRVARVVPAPETIEHVRRRLSECRGEIGEHFGVSLGGCEEPQFLRYRVGDFFVAHQDGNTGLLRSEREQWRKISVVIFLNRQSESPDGDAYCGGSLVFSDWRGGGGRRELRPDGEAGTLVAFRSETTHEVTPVTHGERYSIASWYG
jgi:SM-20-related protein